MCVMTLTNVEKFVEELTCRFKIDMRNLTNFALESLKLALESLKIFHFNGLLLSKVYIVWAKKVQRS